MIAVDVNTIAYLWIPGEFTPLAEQALEKDPHWVTSILWRSEFRNILAGYLRQGQLDQQHVNQCITEAESQLNGHEYLLPSPRVMAKVAASKCSAYDCEYAALADDLAIRLVTSDKQLLREFPGLAVSLQSFVESD